MSTYRQSQKYRERERERCVENSAITREGIMLSSQLAAVIVISEVLITVLMHGR